MASLETLGINLPSLLFHTVNFILLVALLSKFLYKPVVKMLDERAARIKESMDRAEAIKEQLARANADVRLQLEGARKESQAILDQANQISERIRAQARQDAQADADRIVARAREQLDRERQLAVNELRAEVADLVVAAAGRLISQTLDTQAQHQLVEEFLLGSSQKLDD